MINVQENIKLIVPLKESQNLINTAIIGVKDDEIEEFIINI